MLDIVESEKIVKQLLEDAIVIENMKKDFLNNLNNASINFKDNGKAYSNYLTQNFANYDALKCIINVSKDKIVSHLINYSIHHKIDAEAVELLEKYYNGKDWQVNAHYPFSGITDIININNFIRDCIYENNSIQLDKKIDNLIYYLDLINKTNYSKGLLNKIVIGEITTEMLRFVNCTGNSDKSTQIQLIKSLLENKNFKKLLVSLPECPTNNGLLNQVQVLNRLFVLEVVQGHIIRYIKNNHQNIDPELLNILIKKTDFLLNPLMGLSDDINKIIISDANDIIKQKEKNIKSYFIKEQNINKIKALYNNKKFREAIFGKEYIQIIFRFFKRYQIHNNPSGMWEFIKSEKKEELFLYIGEVEGLKNSHSKELLLEFIKAKIG